MIEIDKDLIDQITDNMKNDGFSKNLADQLIKKILLPFQEMLIIIQNYPEILSKIVSDISSQEQSLDNYYDNHYTQLYEQSRENEDLAFLGVAADCALQLKERLLRQEVSICQDFFNESSMINEELNIGELAAEDLLIKIVSNSTKSIVNDIDNKLKARALDGLKENFRKFRPT